MRDNEERKNHRNVGKLSPAQQPKDSHFYNPWKREITQTFSLIKVEARPGNGDSRFLKIFVPNYKFTRYYAPEGQHGRDTRVCTARIWFQIMACDLLWTRQ
jgi:hypothetical protein